MREQATFSRRALAAAFPVAALVGAPAAAVPSASPQHPDAELLQLVDDLQDSEARRGECDQQINDCFDRFEPPEISDALIWRGSDFPAVCSEHPDSLLAQYELGGRLEYVYESVDELSLRWTGPPPAANVFGKPSPRDCKRAAEIIAAVGEWQAATKRAEAAAGYVEASQALDQAVERCCALRRQIIFARASTEEGMMAKVRAMIMLFPDDPTWVEQRLQEAVERSDGADIARWFGMSLALDAMGHAGKTPTRSTTS